MTSELEFRAHQGRAGLDLLMPEWEKLTRTFTTPARFFHQPYWYQAFFSAGVCDADDLWFIAARRSGVLVAVFPLQYQDYRLGIFRPRLLGTIDDDQLQLSDFVFDQTPANEQLFVQLVRWLRGTSDLGWHALRLRKVPNDAALAFAARAALPSATLVLAHDGSCWIDASQGYDAATKPISATFKQDFRRLTRRAEKTHPLKMEICTTPQELAAALPHFLEIEASGWKGGAGNSGAILCKPALLSFYQAVVREFGPRGECVINLLWHGDQAIAGHLCVRESRVLNILKVGFREEFASFAPGILLLDRVIRQTCEDPTIDTLHLVNEPAWARKFKPQRMDVWSYVVANNNPLGWLVLAGVLVKRRMDQFKSSRAHAAAATRPHKTADSERSETQ